MFQSAPSATAKRTALLERLVLRPVRAMFQFAPKQPALVVALLLAELVSRLAQESPLVELASQLAQTLLSVEPGLACALALPSTLTRELQFQQLRSLLMPGAVMASQFVTWHYPEPHWLPIRQRWFERLMLEL